MDSRFDPKGECGFGVQQNLKSCAAIAQYCDACEKFHDGHGIARQMIQKCSPSRGDRRTRMLSWFCFALPML